MAITVSIVQRKGGVGKTTVATHLAAGWATRGLRVCLIDTDSQGDAGRLMGMKSEDGLYNFLADGSAIADVIRPVPNEAYATADNPPEEGGALFLLPSASRTFAIPAVTDNPFLLAERIQAEMADLFDVVVIDTAPTLSALDAYIYLASDYFIYVTECEALSVAGLKDGLAYVQRFAKHRIQYTGKPSQVLGIVPNKMRPATANHRVNLELIAEEYGDLVWPPLTQRTKWTEASNFGQLIYAYAPSSGEAKDAWALVTKAEEVLNNVIA